MRFAAFVILCIASPLAPAVAAHLPSAPRAAHRPGEVLLVLAPGIRAPELAHASGPLAAALARFGLDAPERLCASPAGDIVLVRSARADFDPSVAAAALREQPGVLAAAPNVHMRLHLAPNDPYFPTQWHLGTTAAGVHAQQGWSIHTGSPGQLIAILDTGVDIEHSDLFANVWTNPGEIAGNGVDDDLDGFADDVHGWDFGENDNDPNPVPIYDPVYGIDVGWHGTFVAGLAAAAGNNGVGISGMAWNCRILPLKISDAAGDIPLSAAVNAIAYAVARHASVINMSFGTPDPTARGVFQAAIDAAVDGNAVCVASAGNDGTDTANYPAACDSVLSVAATTPSNVRADWSNWGATVDLAAPGESMWSCIARNYAYDEGSLLFFEVLWGFDGVHAYMYGDGTSFAAPLVSGAVGVVRSQWPNLNAREITLQMVLDGEPHVFDNPIGPKLDLRRALLYALAVQDRGVAAAENVTLASPSPNPATSETLLRLALAAPGRARVDVLDAAGRRVRVLADGALGAGEHALSWDLRDEAGHAVRAGVYFVRATAGDQRSVRRLAVVR